MRAFSAMHRYVRREGNQPKSVAGKIMKRGMRTRKK
jgi:hypothetical protein